MNICKLDYEIIIAWKINKMFRSNIKLNGQENLALGSKNYKMLFEKNLNKWQGISCSWIGKLNVIKMEIFHELIYRFDNIILKIPAGFSVWRNWKVDSKIYREMQMT